MTASPLATTATDGFTSRLRLAGGMVWVLGWLGLFYQFDLPNNPKVSRATIWSLVPLLLDVVDPPPPSPTDLAGTYVHRHTGWRNLAQRGGLIGGAIVIWAAAAGIGAITLRLARRCVFRDATSGTDRNAPPGPRAPTGLALAEEWLLALAVGVGLLSLATLAAGYFGLLHRPSFIVVGGLTALVGAGLLLGDVWGLSRTPNAFEPRAIPTAVPTSSPTARLPRRFDAVSVLAVLGMLPFAAFIVLGAALPSTDFDVNEYHFGGPKEYFLAGRIGFLEHNVYTSFPFLTEMITLHAMVQSGDWERGALAGKVALSGFAFLTAAAVWVYGSRWWGPRVGTCAAFVYLTAPWIFRISTIAYTEGALACYLVLTVLQVARFYEECAAAHQAGRGSTPETLFRAGLIGFLAGSSMACKYPGLLSVVLPSFVALVVVGWRTGLACGGRLRMRSVFVLAATFACGTAIAVGPWLAKNAIETGNPVYPLGYSVFGGRDWSAARETQWRRAHSPDHHRFTDIPVSLLDITAKNDWLSALFYAFAPLSLLAGAGALSRPSRFAPGVAAVKNGDDVSGRDVSASDPSVNGDDGQPCRRISTRGLVLGLWGYLAYFFATWWLFTHRIDRFWVPMLPVVALLAGVGLAGSWLPAAARSLRRWWGGFGLVVCVVVSLYHLAFISSGLCGYNAFFLDMAVAREQVSSPAMLRLERRLAPHDKVLCVGEAALFQARFRYEYNTVFDESLFVRYCGPAFVPAGSESSPSGGADEVVAPQGLSRARQHLAARGITHIYVNWDEVLRYRTTYGFPESITPARFEALVQSGLLAPAEGEFDEPRSLREHPLAADRQAIVDQPAWSPLLIDIAGRPHFRAHRLYRVLPP